MSESAALPEPEADELRRALEKLLDETVDRDDAVEVDVDDVTVAVPLRFGEDSPRAIWGLDGSVTVTVDGIRGPLREWVDLLGEEISEDT